MIQGHEARITEGITHSPHCEKHCRDFSVAETKGKLLSSVHLLSHVLLFVTPYCSTPAFPVHHQLPESTQTYVHQVSDAIQPSHPLSSPSPPAFNLFQHQGHFQ